MMQKQNKDTINSTIEYAIIQCNDITIVFIYVITIYFLCKG
jgi:hypothetical protein